MKKYCCAYIPWNNDQWRINRKGFQNQKVVFQFSTNG